MGMALSESNKDFTEEEKVEKTEEQIQIEKLLDENKKLRSNNSDLKATLSILVNNNEPIIKEETILAFLNGWKLGLTTKEFYATYYDPSNYILVAPENIIKKAEEHHYNRQFERKI